jgi:RNA polymerase sigma-70 factor (ECF subfamily)
LPGIQDSLQGDDAQIWGSRAIFFPQPCHLRSNGHDAARWMNSSFNTTCWTVVLDSAKLNPAESRPALESLCQTYWEPLYSYVRRSGQSHENAQDITQSFFKHLLEKNLPGHADPGLGRFRSYLLSSMRRFVVDYHRTTRSLKRGGHVEHVPIEPELLPSIPSDDETPEAAYDRKWAHTLITLCLDRIQAEQATIGQSERFSLMRPLLLDPGGRGTAAGELTTRFGMTPGSIRTAISRLRARFREIVRQEVARLVADASEIDDEIAYLFRAMQ